MNVVAVVLLSLSLSLVASTVAADAPPTPSGEAVRLDSLLVTGVQPGPGLWRVVHDGHVLWILGTQSPLPKKMQWRSDEVEALVAQAQEVLTEGSANITTDVGMLRGLFLLPSVYAARKNPDGRTLQDVVPADLYARWTVLKRKHIGNRRSIEKWRPLFAAGELYEEAIEDAGLSDAQIVWKAVKKVAGRHDVPITRPMVELTLSDTKATLKRFRSESLQDIACFETTITRLETDLDATRARANAWAIGDLEALRALPHPDNRAACTSALLRNGIAKEQGIDDLPRRTTEAWLDAATAALQKNALTVAVVPLQRLFDDDGYLAGLRARGFDVVEPE